MSDNLCGLWTSSATLFLVRSSGGADSELRAAGLERQSLLRSVELPLLFLRELLPPGHQREVVRDKIYGITTCEGVGNCWLAVNIDNYFNMSVLFFAGADRQSIELGRIPKLKELVAAQPLAAAQFFTHFCDASVPEGAAWWERCPR